MTFSLSPYQNSDAVQVASSMQNELNSLKTATKILTACSDRDDDVARGIVIYSMDIPNATPSTATWQLLDFNDSDGYDKMYSNCVNKLNTLPAASQLSAQIAMSNGKGVTSHIFLFYRGTPVK